MKTTFNNNYTNLIDHSQLLPQLDNPDWVVIDCRFDLFDPSWGFSNYQHSHIPGAVFAHLEVDLSGPISPLTGRHPLPDPVVFQNTLGRLGVSKEKQVVVYDTTNGSFAARLWWLLKFYGHPKVAVLDGGFSIWKNSGLPVVARNEVKTPELFTGVPNLDLVISTPELEKLMISGDAVLIDARSPERFRGEVEPIDRIAGRIPGAKNRFHNLNLTPEGTLLPPTELRSQFLSLLGTSAPSNVIVYCGSGVTSCHHLLALSVADLPMARLYAGSWSEWITNSDRPIETG